MICTKKGFTLTELLVVVMVIGVLAAVILPKYNKVLETRKTTEAEEFLAAMRDEQEFLCMEKGKYEKFLDRLNVAEGLERTEGTVAECRVQSAYYVYCNSVEGKGVPAIIAKSRGEQEYAIGIRLTDGMLACEKSEGGPCDNLSKDYSEWDAVFNESDVDVKCDFTD